MYTEHKFGITEASSAEQERIRFLESIKNQTKGLLGGDREYLDRYLGSTVSNIRSGLKEIGEEKLAHDLLVAAVLKSFEIIDRLFSELDNAHSLHQDTAGILQTIDQRMSHSFVYLASQIPSLERQKFKSELSKAFLEFLAVVQERVGSLQFAADFYAKLGDIDKYKELRAELKTTLADPDKQHDRELFTQDQQRIPEVLAAYKNLTVQLAKNQVLTETLQEICDQILNLS